MNLIAVGVVAVAALSGGAAETKESLAAHLRHGRAALELSKWPAAIEAFRAAMRVDPKCADAYHGAGIAAYSGGNVKAAVEHLEKAYSLYDPPTRAAAFNLAAAHLKTNPMRTAKLAKEYLSRPDAEEDEQFHNLMGRALFYAAGPQARQNPLWQECKKVYLEYNATLAERRGGGRKRWGSEWVPAKVADGRWSQLESRVQAVERLRVEMTRAEARVKKAHNDRYEMATDMRLYSSREKREINRRYADAWKSEKSTRARLDSAEAHLSQTEKPPLPEAYRMRPMDAAPTAAK